MKHQLTTPRQTITAVGLALTLLVPAYSFADEKDAAARKICSKLSADECCEIAWDFFHGKNGMEQDSDAAKALFKESCRIYKKTKRGDIAEMCCSVVPTK